MILRFRSIPLVFAAIALVCTALSGAAAPSKPSTGVKNDFAIPKTTVAYRIDGVLDEPFWKESGALDNFRVNANPGLIPLAATKVKMAYTDAAFLVAFICDEPGIAKGANVGSLLGDFCEFSLFSRPETPYYSPYLQRLDYMNANEAVRTMRRFTISPANARTEARVYKEGPHTPYIIDESWNCPWESAVKATSHGYIMETAVPWEHIGGMPKPGHTFRLNFIRTRKIYGDESSCFNWFSSPNITVKRLASKSFFQEYPTIFATADVKDDRMVLTRFVETVDPWRVERPRPEYERALTNRAMPDRAIHFYLGLSDFLLPDSIRKLYDTATWKAEEDRLFTEFGLAGVNGPFLPGFMNRVGGVAGLDSLYKKYGMKFNYHPWVSGDAAKKAGATILTPSGSAAFFDPVYIRMKQETLADWLGKFGKSPWLFDVRGADEPFNQIATILQPGTYERVDREIREAYGVGLGVPKGIPGKAYQDQPVHENSLRVPDHQTSLERIAAFRWLNRTYADVARGEYELAKNLAPGALYQAYNRNSVADLDFLDQSLIMPYTDFVSADPYPSFCMYVYGTARCKYHVGFIAKMVTDFAVGKPTQMIVQGCEMIQRLSTAENVREWASQAAKAGVSIIDWWGTPRLQYPEVYREMMRISKIWKTLPALDIPAHADIAVLFSDDSRAAAGDEALTAHYYLHAIVGEKVGAWFTFVSENHVRRNLQSLDGYRLFIAPQLAYSSKEFAGDLIRRVEEGATLVALDPDTFTWDIESGSLAAERSRLLGLGECAKRPAAELRPSKAGAARFKGVGNLVLRPMRNVGNVNNARILKVPDGATMLYTYPDGAPAAYSKKLGKGEVIVFGAMPFHDCELAIKSSGWEKLFAALADERGIKRDLPVWRFLFPATGGDPKIFEPLVKLPVR